jgi:hypothetical protein
LPEDKQNYTESLIIDRRSTVEQLKLKIVEYLGESLDCIIFRRGGSHGAELIEDGLGLKQANVYNMMSIFVERGEPTRQGWKRIRLFIAQYYNPDWTQLIAHCPSPNVDGNQDDQLLREPHDHEFFTFTSILTMPIRTLDKVIDVKKSIVEKLTALSKQEGGTFSKELRETIASMTVDNLRLREKLSDKLA